MLTTATTLLFFSYNKITIAAEISLYLKCFYYCSSNLAIEIELYDNFFVLLNSKFFTQERRFFPTSDSTNSSVNVSLQMK